MLYTKAILDEIIVKIHIIDGMIHKTGFNPVWDNNEYMICDEYINDIYIKLLCDKRVKLEQERKEAVFHLDNLMGMLSNER